MDRQNYKQTKSHGLFQEPKETAEKLLRNNRITLLLYYCSFALKVFSNKIIYVLSSFNVLIPKMPNGIFESKIDFARIRIKLQKSIQN